MKSRNECRVGFCWQFSTFAISTRHHHMPNQCSSISLHWNPSHFRPIKPSIHTSQQSCEKHNDITPYILSVIVWSALRLHELRCIISSAQQIVPTTERSWIKDSCAQSRTTKNTRLAANMSTGHYQVSLSWHSFTYNTLVQEGHQLGSFLIHSWYLQLFLTASIIVVTLLSTWFKLNSLRD